ncbi:unnamed protein product [Rhizophagus irregularis]|nr:unnamed protein product [Rhizophagus irregularis]
MNLREKSIDGTPKEYQQLYQKCWDDESNSRPDIEEILYNSIRDLIPEGLTQVLFAVNGKFTAEEISMFELFENVIFEIGILEYVTMILLNALKHLHHYGINHRDIKLSNILVTANDEIKLVFFVTDFSTSSLTPTLTAMVGTIPYMAPDVLVWSDQPYDTKVDIWSVGVCILELLTRKAAWRNICDDEFKDKLRQGEMPYVFRRLRKKADITWKTVDVYKEPKK